MKCELFLNRLESNLTNVSAIPVVGTLAGLGKMLLGITQTITSLALLIFSKITSRPSLSKFAALHFKHGIGNIIAGSIETIFVIQTLAFFIRRRYANAIPDYKFMPYPHLNRELLLQQSFKQKYDLNQVPIEYIVSRPLDASPFFPNRTIKEGYHTSEEDISNMESSKTSCFRVQGLAVNARQSVQENRGQFIKDLERGFRLNQKKLTQETYQAEFAKTGLSKSEINQIEALCHQSSCADAQVLVMKKYPNFYCKQLSDMELELVDSSTKGLFHITKDHGLEMEMKCVNYYLLQPIRHDGVPVEEYQGSLKCVKVTTVYTNPNNTKLTDYDAFIILEAPITIAKLPE